MANKHMPYDLAQMQSLPLETKNRMSMRRIRDWYDHWDGKVYVSFSGGKDSTVLADLCARICQVYGWTLYLVFINTGLEYPEIQKFVKSFAEWLRITYGIEVVLEILRPKMRFDEVLKKHGYPVISKEVSQVIREAKIGLARNDGSYEYRIKKINGEMKKADGTKSNYNCEKWKFVLDAPFDVSEECCKVMKKQPAKQYEKLTGRKPIIGTMASESRNRYTAWLRYGCNSFEKNRLSSNPLSFWTGQDILHYIKKYMQPEKVLDLVKSLIT